MSEAAKIHSEKLALKLAESVEVPALADQIYERPRLHEALWFVQWQSMQPGGLGRFAREFAAEFVDSFSPEPLVKAKGRKLTYEEKRLIFENLPPAVQGKIGGFSRPLEPAAFLDETPIPAIDYERQLQISLKQWDGERITSAIKECIASGLPAYLLSVCQDPQTDFSGETKFCSQDVLQVLITGLDSHRDRVLTRLAKTAVVEQVFDALDYAQSERCMVRIEGDSRFGKTESIKAWCESRPGLARLVSVPSSNTLWDLLRRVADAFGIPWTYRTGHCELKLKVEYVVKNSGMFIVMDEGAFLLPQSYNRDSAPVRLNWVRTEIADRGLPLAIVVTPQSYHLAVDRFVQKTSYAMEQFNGRTMLPVVLPCELDEKDMVAVARINFPELDEDSLGYVAAAALTSENYLMGVEAIARRARFLSKRHGGQAISLADLDKAISEVIPGHVKPGQGEDEARPQPGNKRQKSRPEMPAKATVSGSCNTFLNRLSAARKPSGNEDSEGEDLQSSSLRGAGPERVKPELISVEP